MAEVSSHKVGHRHKLQKSSEKHIRANGLFMLFLFDAQYFVVGFFDNLDLHKAIPFFRASVVEACAVISYPFGFFRSVR